VTSGYAKIPRATIIDDRISAESLGVLCWLLGHGPGWELNPGAIGRNFRFGRDKTQKIIRELVDAGYIVRDRTRDRAGRWRWTSTIYADSVTATPAKSEKSNTITPAPGPRPDDIEDEAVRIVEVISAIFPHLANASARASARRWLERGYKLRDVRAAVGRVDATRQPRSINYFLPILEEVRNEQNTHQPAHAKQRGALGVSQKFAEIAELEHWT
jgi:hypothetical protein